MRKRKTPPSGLRRYLNRDGTFNVFGPRVVGHSPGSLSLVFDDPLVGADRDDLAVYVAINIVFAGLYVACGPDALSGSSWRGSTPR